MRNAGEWKACLFLRKLGHIILAHNFRTERTELDIISLDLASERCLHFTEVKAHNGPWKHPLSSQTALRRHKTRKAAQTFLFEYVAYLRAGGHKAPGMELNTLDCCICFDLIWVKRDGLEYFPSIF